MICTRMFTGRSNGQGSGTGVRCQESLRGVAAPKQSLSMRMRLLRRAAAPRNDGAREDYPLAELTSKERVMRALQRQEPDRVPHFEWLVDRRVRDAILPGCRDHNDFAVRMGHDAVLVDPNFTKEPFTEGRYRSEWGYIGQKTQEEHGIEVESPIATHGRLRAVHPARSPGAGALCIGRKGVGAIRRTIRGHRPPQRRVFAAALPDGHGEPAHGDRGRARADPGARGYVGGDQPGDGQGARRPRRADRLYRG